MLMPSMCTNTKHGIRGMVIYIGLNRNVPVTQMALGRHDQWVSWLDGCGLLSWFVGSLVCWLVVSLFVCALVCLFVGWLVGL